MAPLPVVKRVKLGSQGMETSQQGLGCMGMSFFFGPPKPEKDMIDLIHYAVDCGVTYMDTSQAYGPFTNEILVGKGVKGIREKVEIGTKFGMLVNEKKQMDFRADPASVRACCEASLKRLDTDYIDLYTLHRVDPKVPIEITVGALKELVEEGKVKYIGLSEASSSEIRRAHAVHPITAVQLEWSLWSRDVEEDIIGTCRELGIGIVAYSPLGQGFFGGLKAEELADNDMRKTRMPRVSPANYENNKKYFDRLVEIGKKHGKTPGQVALAWVQHKGEDVVSIPGTTKTKNLDENISSLAITFTKEEIEEIETAVPAEDITGDRYPSMHHTWRYASTPPLSSWQGTKA